MSISGAFKQGFANGFKPLIPAFKLLLTIMLPAAAIMLLGAGLVVVDRWDGLLRQGILSTIGEGLMLAGGLMAAAGSVLAWLKMFISAGFVGQNHEGQRR